MRTCFAAVLAVVALCAGQSRSAAERCVPVAVVDGDEQLARPVLRELRSLGVATARESSCPAARARVTRVGTHLGITMLDADGRVHTRTVSTAGVAATWIESRVRDDIGAPLLAVRALPPEPAPATSVRSDSRAAVSGAPVVSTLPSSFRFMISSATATDESSWRRVSVGGCVLVEWLCLGFEGTYASSTGHVTDVVPMPVDRSGIDLMFTISAPQRVGRGTLSPQLAAGVGWLTTSRAPLVAEPPPEPGCDGNDPTDPNSPTDPPPCVPGDPIEIDDGLRAPTTSLRTEASLRYALPLTDAASLELGVGILWSPGAHQQSFRFDDVIGPDGSVFPDNVEGVPPDPMQSLPGEPAWMWSAGIGVRVVLP